MSQIGSRKCLHPEEFIEVLNSVKLGLLLVIMVVGRKSHFRLIVFFFLVLISSFKRRNGSYYTLKFKKGVNCDKETSLIEYPLMPWSVHSKTILFKI